MKKPAAPEAGLSLPELLTTVAIIGILCGIAIAGYAGLHTGAREGVSRDTVALLNRAVLHFNQANWTLRGGADNNSTSDELAILRSLQWRDTRPQKATPGSPYISPRFADGVSSSSSDYRIRWNGNAFELLVPGDAGSGLKTGTTAPEATTEHTFAEGYQPFGAPQ